MPTTKASGTQHPDTNPELLKAAKAERVRRLEDLLTDAERNRYAAMERALRRLRNDYPQAPSATLAGWLHLDAEVLKTLEVYVKAEHQLKAAKDLDHVNIVPSKTEAAVARLDCARRQRRWSNFTRQLDRQARRRHDARHRQQAPATSSTSTGREARPSTSTRTQGSRRTTSATGSRSSGDDSGSSGDPDPSGLAQTGRETQNEHRYCRGCGLRLVGLAPQARDHGPACTTRWRRRGKAAAEPVDGVDYGPGCQTQAEIEQAIRRHRQQVTYRYQQVTKATDLDTVLELVEQATSDRRQAWVQGNAELAARHDYDLDRLWAAVRERREGTGDRVYRRRPAGKVHG